MPLGANKAAIMGVAGVSTGDVVLLGTTTADSDALVTFTGLMTSTYGEYIFKFYNMNPETDSQQFSFQVNATDGADFNDSAITSTFFRAGHTEADDGTVFEYTTDKDQAQGTAFQSLTVGTGSDTDESAAGELHIFNPSSTTYVKHFYAITQEYHSSILNTHNFISGYINDTTAIDDIQFKFASGDFEGKIKMWGVK